MNEQLDGDLDQLESLIHEAGKYADVTPDLRPLILRAAMRKRDRSRLRRVTYVAVFVALTLPLVGSPLERSLSQAPPMLTSLADSPNGEWMPIQKASDLLLAASILDGKDGTWGAVDIFRHIHQRRREMFSLSR